MTSIVKFTPLYGSHSENPLCSLLEVDQYRILLDCGWDDDFDPRLLKPLGRIAPKIDLVLISHPDLKHCGALPYAFAHLGLKAKVLATMPVYKMGQMFAYDAVLSRCKYEDFRTVTLDDVDEAFEHVIPLKYSQHYTLKEGGMSIDITPYAAGHMVGGTVWQLKKETDDIVYAVDYNHKKERHLSPSVLETLFHPTLLITDASNALYQEESRKRRDIALFDQISATLRKGGNVLLPVDTAGRVLELLVLLDQHWTSSRHTASLCFLSHMGFNTLESSKGHLEWMSELIMKRFVSNRENTFNFRNVKLCHSLLELQKLPEPRVVLSTQPDLTPGFALDLFMAWAPDPSNRVIFTNKSRPGTLARRLLENPSIGNLYLQRCLKEDLVDEELEAELDRRRKAAEAKLKEEREAEERARQRAARNSMLDYDGEDTDHLLSISSLFKGYSVYADKAQFELSKLPSNQLGGKFLMFPTSERLSVYDVYGERVRVENYERLSSALADDQEDLDRMDLDDGDENEDEDDDDEEEETPFKFVRQKFEVIVNCAISYIDFEGKSDGRSIKKILSHVQPRKVILMGGTTDGTNHLANYISKLANPPSVILAPRPGETVDVTEATDIFRLHLKTSFLESLSFVESSSGAKLAYIDGMTNVPPNEQDDQGRWFRPEPYLDVLPQTEHSGHDAVFIGDVKLSDFRDQLISEGFMTEFKQGLLVVNGTVGIRRDPTAPVSTARLMMEGSLSPDYLRVKELLYGQFDVL